MLKKIVILLLSTSILLTGCSAHTITDAIDKDLGTDTGVIADEVDEFVNNDIEDIDYADKIKNLLDKGKDVVDIVSNSNLQSSESLDSNSCMKAYFLDIGQGDCTIITCGDEAMIIDAGDNDKGTYIQNYLQKLGITSLKYVLGTHCDADHYGGLDVIITKFNCENIILSDYKKDTRTCEDVYKAIDYKDYSVTKPDVGDVYSLGNATFTILAPNNYDYGDNTNNYSIALLLQYGKTKILFTGDAEKEAENDMMENGLSLKADIYHVGHHGSKSASSEEFMKCVNPEYAVISCGVNNDYGHPHSATLDLLRGLNTKVYRTDEQGTIIAESNGQKITWNCYSSDTWKPGE